MKERILKKIANKLSQFGMLQTPEETYEELCNCRIKCFNAL